MKNNFLKKIIVLAWTFSILGCTTASTDDLIDPMEVDLTTYTEHVQPIITNNCITCHSNPPVNGTSMPLTTYEFVKNAVETRGLLDRIQRQEGQPGAMPNGGPRLPQPLIDLIVQWEADGLLE